MTVTGPTRFTAIEVGGWRDYGACSRHDDLTLWDAAVGEEKEPSAERERRHAAAKAICWNSCPVRAECAAAVDWHLDEGVRGGHVLPTLTARVNGNASARDLELLDLLQRGIPLDFAAPHADRLARGAGRPPKAATA